MGEAAFSKQVEVVIFVLMRGQSQGGVGTAEGFDETILRGPSHPQQL